MSRPRQDATRLRSFIALELSEQFRQQLGALAEPLKPCAPGARFVRPDGSHLTLRFLGEASPGQIERLGPALLAAAQACPPTDATLTGLGLFPAHGSPRVLWAGFALAEPVLRLQAACEAAAVAAGFVPEARPFQAHLTLARWRERAARPPLTPLRPLTVRLDRMVLFHSELLPEGARHTALQVFPLDAVPAPDPATAGI